MIPNNDVHTSNNIQDIRQNYWTMKYRSRWPTFVICRSDSITSLKFKSIKYHRSIALNSTNLILFLREKVNEEISYNSKRGRDRINLPSMRLTGIYDPFHVIDFLSWCSSWFGDKICNVLQKFSISNWLLDNSQGWRLSTGRFRYWNFPFAFVNSFGKSGRWNGAETSSCRTSENHVCCGQRGAIGTILHWEIGVSCSG